MNEKLSRPQFNQMDTTEKQTLMESLAARYDMTFLGLLKMFFVKLWLWVLITEF